MRLGILRSREVIVPCAEDAAALARLGFYGRDLLKPRSSTETLTGSVHHAFILSSYEVIWLMEALQILLVQSEDGTSVSSTECWAIFCQANPQFPSLYCAYHYFRSRRWIVLSGLKYGTDFTIYEHSPDTDHAQYAVLVRSIFEGPFTTQVYDESDTDEKCIDRISHLNELEALVRLCNLVSKSTWTCARLPLIAGAHKSLAR